MNLSELIYKFIEDSYECRESPPSTWAGDFDETLNGETSQDFEPKLISSPRNDLGKKASRAMREIARQGSVIRSLPQRMKVKHTAAWQTMFNRPQSSPSEGGKLVSADSRPLKPNSVRSLTPVSIQRGESKDALTRGSLPDTNLLIAGDTENEFFPLNTENSIEETWNKPVQAQCVMETVKDPPKECPPRSDLQRQHQEWRRAMLEAVSSTEDEKRAGPKFLHGDLYDTLFTLQTLNSMGGLEDFLSRVRSVYENNTSILKPAKPTNVKSTVQSKSPQRMAYSNY